MWQSAAANLQATASVTLLSSAIDATSRLPADGLYSDGAMMCSITAKPCRPCAMPTATRVTCIGVNASAHMLHEKVHQCFAPAWTSS